MGMKSGWSSLRTLVFCRRYLLKRLLTGHIVQHPNVQPTQERLSRPCALSSLTCTPNSCCTSGEDGLRSLDKWQSWLCPTEGKRAYVFTRHAQKGTGLHIKFQAI